MSCKAHFRFFLNNLQLQNMRYKFFNSILCLSQADNGKHHELGYLILHSNWMASCFIRRLKKRGSTLGNGAICLRMGGDQLLDYSSNWLVQL